MKKLNIVLLLILLTLMNACDKKEIPTTTPESPKTVIGILHEDPGSLFYADGELDRLLEILHAESVDSSKYIGHLRDTTAVQSSIEFRAEKLNDLEEYLEMYQPGEVGTSTLLIIYKNAQCGKQHPGFISACIGTFGPHQRFGASMFWTVNKYKSCIDGQSTCIERLRIVGQTTYFPQLKCLGADSVHIQRPIRRLRCD